ncbi:hypothetical protein NUW54_g5983 [Trametes sanguinea]|uniref:Uncharacterized protein n=1 Tax=Trametes sanguinea TaxID=158606 RepID=A0ACC1PVG0_9APHY|nr:hypothetical protein NUW54_g5983 [Trametes sanguinea]
MPPGRKSKQLPTFIQPVVGQDTLQCTLCSQSLKRDSLNGHLKSAGHKKSEAHHEEAAARARERETQQSVSVAAKEAIEYAMLTDLPALCEPSRSQSSGAASRSDAHAGQVSARPSAQEETLWSNLEQDHSDLALDIDGGTAVRRNQEQLEEGISTYGLWNPTRAASDLGFLFGKEPSQPPDEAAPEALDDTLSSAPREEDSFLAELLGNIDLDHAHRVSGNASYDTNDSHARTRSSAVDPNSDTYPYPNYPTFLADVLDNGLTRLPVPESLMKLFLYILRECGVHDAPTLYELRSIQRDLRKKCGVPTIPCKSPQGNVFWMVDPRAIIARDWSNEDTRRAMHVYPVIPDGPISEVIHTVRWHEGIDRSTLSPMYDARDKHYYIDELCQLVNGDFVIPQRWVIYRKSVHAEVFRLTSDSEGKILVDKTCADLVPVKSLWKNLYDLMSEHGLPELGGAYITYEDAVYTTQNPLREVAEGDPLYSSYVNHFADDVSGNRSKSWNKHYNAYITHANLPRRFLQQEAHIHFVSTSPHASATEQFYHFKQVIESTHTHPVKVFDPLTRSQARFRIFVHAEPSDNPMQSEISGHIRGNGNLFCRKCKAGGTTAEKESNDGFHALFEPGDPRSKEHILTELRAQVEKACLGVEKAVKERQTTHGVKDAYTQHFIDALIQRARTLKKDNPGRTDTDIQKELLTWVDENANDIYNPFLTMRGLDPTLDTPIEILHTVLLGVVKYAWHWSHTSWTPAQKTTYAHRLQATNTDALSVHAIRSNYILQYAKSLIGRQLKTVVQTTSFHVHDILEPLKFALWLAVGEMTALIWFPEIHEMELYKADLKVAIANVLDLFAEIDPSKIVEKIKLHVLSHAPEDVARFGPLLGVITESFESFNGTSPCSFLTRKH